MPWSSPIRTLSRRMQDHRRAYLHAKSDKLAFRSGIGDSTDLLYGLARSMKPDIAVEIGSARGKSAAAVGMALKENGRGKLLAIDPHRQTEWNDHESIDTFEIITHHLRVLEVTEYVEIVRKTSEEAAKAWTRPIDMIFIDGDHSYEGVKRDWQLFMPHVRPFGVIVFHDTLWDIRPDPRFPSRADMGVPRFVDELRAEGYPVLTIDRDFGVSLVQPVKGGARLRPPAS